MSRYIEQDYIGSAAAHLPTKTLQTEHGIELVVSVTDVIEIIKNAPSIDIVRCGECKMAEKTKFTNFEGDFVYRKTCPVRKGFIDAGGFCSYGERKNDE